MAEVLAKPHVAGRLGPRQVANAQRCRVRGADASLAPPSAGARLRFWAGILTGVRVGLCGVRGIGRRGRRGAQGEPVAIVATQGPPPPTRPVRRARIALRALYNDLNMQPMRISAATTRAAP